jgi:hypothetical protein
MESATWASSRRENPNRSEELAGGRATAQRPVSASDDEATVDVDRLARHVVRIAASEKAHDASHVFGSFGSTEPE